MSTPIWSPLEKQLLAEAVSLYQHSITDVRERWRKIRDYVAQGTSKDPNTLQQLKDEYGGPDGNWQIKSAKDCATYLMNPQNRKELETIAEVLNAQKESEDNELKDLQRKQEIEKRVMEETRKKVQLERERNRERMERAEKLEEEKRLKEVQKQQQMLKEVKEKQLLEQQRIQLERENEKKRLEQEKKNRQLFEEKRIKQQEQQKIERREKIKKAKEDRLAKDAAEVFANFGGQAVVGTVGASSSSSTNPLNQQAENEYNQQMQKIQKRLQELGGGGVSSSKDSISGANFVGLMNGGNNDDMIRNLIKTTSTNSPRGQGGGDSNNNNSSGKKNKKKGNNLNNQNQNKFNNSNSNTNQAAADDIRNALMSSSTYSSTLHHPNAKRAIQAEEDSDQDNEDDYEENQDNDDYQSSPEEDDEDEEEEENSTPRNNNNDINGSSNHNKFNDSQQGLSNRQLQILQQSRQKSREKIQEEPQSNQQQRQCYLCYNSYEEQCGGFWWHYQCGHSEICPVCALKNIKLRNDRRCPLCFVESSICILTKLPFSETDQEITGRSFFELYRLQREEGEGSYFSTDSRLKKVLGLVDGLIGIGNVQKSGSSKLKDGNVDDRRRIETYVCFDEDEVQDVTMSDKNNGTSTNNTSITQMSQWDYIESFKTMISFTKCPYKGCQWRPQSANDDDEYSDTLYNSCVPCPSSGKGGKKGGKNKNNNSSNSTANAWSNNADDPLSLRAPLCRHIELRHNNIYNQNLNGNSKGRGKKHINYDDVDSEVYTANDSSVSDAESQQQLSTASNLDKTGMMCTLCIAHENEFPVFHDKFNSLEKLRNHQKQKHEQCKWCTTKEIMIQKENSINKNNNSNNGNIDSAITLIGNPKDPLYFYDKPHLNRHLRDWHEKCFACENNVQHPKIMWFEDYDALWYHFEEQHYVCNREECWNPSGKYNNIFSCKEDLELHNWKHHGGPKPREEVMNKELRQGVGPGGGRALRTELMESLTNPNDLDEETRRSRNIEMLRSQFPSISEAASSSFQPPERVGNSSANNTQQTTSSKATSITSVIAAHHAKSQQRQTVTAQAAAAKAKAKSQNLPKASGTKIKGTAHIPYAGPKQWSTNNNPQLGMFPTVSESVVTVTTVTNSNTGTSRGGGSSSSSNAKPSAGGGPVNNNITSIGGIPVTQSNSQKKAKKRAAKKELMNLAFNRK